MRMRNVGDIQDVNFTRSLTSVETTNLHNAWMNDVEDWMIPDCLQEYNDYIKEANELDEDKGKGREMIPSVNCKFDD